MSKKNTAAKTTAAANTASWTGNIKNVPRTIHFPEQGEVTAEQFSQLCQMAAAYALYNKLGNSLREQENSEVDFQLLELLTESSNNYSQGDLEAAKTALSLGMVSPHAGETEAQAQVRIAGLFASQRRAAKKAAPKKAAKKAAPKTAPKTK